MMTDIPYVEGPDFIVSVSPAGVSATERRIRAAIAAEIEAFADDHSDVSDAYRHAALIAKGTPPA